MNDESHYLTILKENLERKIKISTEDVSMFLKKFNLVNFNKKEYLSTTRSICRYYYFILEGMVRTYYINPKGKEHITSFAIENWWVTDLESFIHQKKASLNLQAVEPTVALAISHDNLQRAFEELPVLNKFYRIQMENMLMAVQRRHDFYMHHSAKDRYHHFVTCVPSFAQRIPQYMLASYLDLTPEYLSEIRGHKTLNEL